MGTPITTPITLEAFKTITASDGKFTTWTDIINFARTVLPINEEILGAPFKSMQQVTGDNIVLENISTKFVEQLRTELTDNNKLELNKMVMYLYNDYMTSFEYSILDQKSAADWSTILSDSIEQMFITKKDISNMLALDELQRIAIALGEFTIITGGADLPAQVADYPKFKKIGAHIVRYLANLRRKRTKFSKGINTNRIQWVNSPEFGLNLLLSQTSSYSGSNAAYRDTQTQRTVYEFFGTQFTESTYLGSNIGMNEFKVIGNANGNQGQVQNAGSGTGNIIKPFQFDHLLSIAWLPESLLYYGHNFTQTDVPQVNNRMERVITFAWRAQVAISPIFAGFNHIFVKALPNFASYIDRNGKTVPAVDTSNYDQWLAMKKAIRAEQPMLYNTIIDANGYTSNGIKDTGAYGRYKTAQTITL